MQYSESNVPFFLFPSPLFMIMIKYIACRVQSKCLVSLFEFLRFLWHHTTSNIYQPFHTRILGSELNRRLSVMKYFEVYWISMPNLNSIIYPTVMILFDFAPCLISLKWISNFLNNLFNERSARLHNLFMRKIKHQKISKAS